MGVAVDTNIIVRLLVNQPEELASKARTLVEEARPGELLVDRIVLAEVLYVLRSNYQMPRKLAADVLNDLLRNDVFAFIDPQVCKYMLSIMQTTALSPQDACLAALASAGMSDGVHTFDEALAKFVARK